MLTCEKHKWMSFDSQCPICIISFGIDMAKPGEDKTTYTLYRPKQLPISEYRDYWRNNIIAANIKNAITMRDMLEGFLTAHGVLRDTDSSKH